MLNYLHAVLREFAVLSWFLLVTNRQILKISDSSNFISYVDTCVKMRALTHTFDSIISIPSFFNDTVILELLWKVDTWIRDLYSKQHIYTNHKTILTGNFNVLLSKASFSSIDHVRTHRTTFGSWKTMVNQSQS